VEQPAVSAYVPPKERRVQKKLMMIGGGVVLLIAAFVIGSMIHGKDPVVAEDEKAEAIAKSQVKPPPRANVTLVPVTAADLEEPITSAPLPVTSTATPTEYQRSDATAVASDQYALLAARAREEKKKGSAPVDPRTVTGDVYSGAPTRSTESPTTNSEESREESPSESTSEERSGTIATRTRPIPDYQPMPDIRVSQRTTARLDLVIGADGRVKEVNVRDPIPGETARLIATVQSWRFKPATENGQPVSSTYSVDLSFE
jgi:hypothetical protein